MTDDEYRERLAKGLREATPMHRPLEPWLDPRPGELWRWRSWLEYLGIYHEVSHSNDDAGNERHELQFVATFANAAPQPGDVADSPRRFKIRGGDVMTELEIRREPPTDEVTVFRIGGADPEAAPTSAHDLLGKIVKYRSVADAKPVSWVRRRALDAVMAWVRDREAGKGRLPCGPEREYVDGAGVTTISGAGKVYASEAVDRMEKLLVDGAVPEMLALLRETKVLFWAGESPVGQAWEERRDALLARFPKEDSGG